MQIAIVVFDRITALDAVGPYEILSRIPDAEVVLTATSSGPVRSDVGSLALMADAALADIASPDIVVVPGGPGVNDHLGDGPLRDWLREVDRTSTWTTSVCVGSLILAAAGLLEDRRATSHWLALGELERLGAEPVSERVVTDGKYITAAGVSAGIDMALGLAATVAGDSVAQAIQLGTEYDPQPPFDAGSPDKAPAEITTYLRSRSRFVMH